MSHCLIIDFLVFRMTSNTGNFIGEFKEDFEGDFKVDFEVNFVKDKKKRI